MADDQATSTLHIPADTATKFGSIIELLKSSESMNDEERQYWINILPVMNEEQIQNLRDILESEKKQLADIDKKYSENAMVKEVASIEVTESKIKAKKEERSKKEQQEAVHEEKAEEDILKQIQSM